MGLPYTAELTVKANAWFDVADGWELESVSERDVACGPVSAARKEPSAISQPEATVDFIDAVTFCCVWDTILSSQPGSPPAVTSMVYPDPQLSVPDPSELPQATITSLAAAVETRLVVTDCKGLPIGLFGTAPLAWTSTGLKTSRPA